MNRRVKKKDHENLSDTAIQKVIDLLNPADGKSITKKEACEMLNISYNTTRLQKILDEYVENREYRKKRRADLKGKPASDFEIRDAVQSYLRGENITTIANNLYRSPSFVKNLLDRVGVPLRPTNKEEGQYLDLIPEECISEDFEVGEIVWSAKYHRTAIIKARYTKEYQEKCKGVKYVDYEAKYGAPGYSIYVIENSETTEDMWASVETGGYYAFSIAYDLGKLNHLEKYGIDLRSL